MNILSRLDTYTGKLEGTDRGRICTEQVLLTDIVRPPEISSKSRVAVFPAILGLVATAGSCFILALQFLVSDVLPRQAKELEAAISSYKADMQDAACNKQHTCSLVSSLVVLQFLACHSCSVEVSGRVMGANLKAKCSEYLFSFGNQLQIQWKVPWKLLTRSSKDRQPRTDW